MARAFTLIEVMIVVAIIGILAAIAVPNFVKFQCRAKQGEAKTNLKAMFAAQESYRAQADGYDPSFSCTYSSCSSVSNAVGFVPRGDQIRYSYSYSSTGPGQFTGVAIASGPYTVDLGNDAWSIDQDSALSNAVNGCR